MCVCVCVSVCVHAFYLLVHSAEWHAGATLWRVGLSAASPLSLPGQMAHVTEREGGAMEGKGKGGRGGGGGL